MDGTPAPGVYRAGPWLLDTRALELRRDGEVRAIRSQLSALLVYLIEHGDRVVTRNELIDAIWDGNYLSGQTGLTNAISSLRKLVETDELAGSRAIQTVPRKGYRLQIKPVGRADEVDEPSGQTGLPRRWYGTVAVVAVAVLAVGIFVGRQQRPDAHRFVLPLKATALTSLPGSERYPRISPDGQWLAFAWEREGEQPGLFIMPMAGGEPRRLTQTDDRDLSPQWSADGLTVYFTRLGRNRSCEIRSVGILAADDERVAPCDWNFTSAYAISPQGDLARAVGLGYGTDWGGILVTDEASQRWLKTYQREDFLDFNLNFSPEGDALAFTSMNSLAHNQLVVGWLNSAETRVLNPTAAERIHGHAWSVDGSRLIYASNRGGEYTLLTASVDSGEIGLLGVAVANAHHPHLSADGRTLVFERRSVQQDIVRVDLESGLEGLSRVVSLIGSTGMDTDPDHSPVAGRLLFRSDRTGATELWSALPDGTQTTQLTHLGGQVQFPSWSPDGQKIAFTAPGNPGGRQQIQIMELDSGHHYALSSEPADHLYLSWSEDSSAVLSARADAGQWNVWRYPLNGEPPTQLTRDGGLHAQPSGDWVYFVRLGDPRIYRARADGSQGEVVVDTGNGNLRTGWLVTAQGLIFLSSDGSNDLVYRLSDSGPRILARLERGTLNRESRLAFLPDDNALVISRVGKREVDIMQVRDPFEPR